MSKGKRKSLPGSVAVVREKMRTSTLSTDDRELLLQVSRVDLIALIERELGVVLKSSQKNSVRAMVDWLIGPEEGTEQPTRSRRAAASSRRSTPQQTVQSLPEDDGEEEEEDEEEEEEDPHDAASFDGFADISDSQAIGASQSAGPSKAADVHGPQQTEAQMESFWMHELHMQLNAAAATAAGGSITTQPADVGDQQDHSAQLQCFGPVAAAAAPQPAPAGSAPPAADEQLADQLLQQLLQDMQLNAAPQQQLQQQWPQDQNHLLLLHQQHQQQQQQSQQLFLHAQPHLLQQQQQQQLQQQTLQLQLLGQQPCFSAAASATAAAGALSCPLPAGALEDPVMLGAHALSSEQLLQWQQTDAAAAGAAGNMLGKRNKQQVWNTLYGVEREAAPMAVELSGPSADLAVKRMSFVMPGTSSVSALATSTAGTAINQGLMSSQRELPSLAFDAFMAEQQQQQQQQPRQQGVKGLARKFKTLLRGRANKANQQACGMGATPSAGSAPAPDIWATLANEAAGGMPCGGHLHSMPAVVGQMSPQPSLYMCTGRMPSAPVPDDFHSQLLRLRALYGGQEEAGQQLAEPVHAAQQQQQLGHDETVGQILNALQCLQTPTAVSAHAAGDAGAAAAVAVAAAATAVVGTPMAAAAVAAAGSEVPSVAAPTRSSASQDSSEQRGSSRGSKAFAKKLSKVFRLGSSNRTPSPDTAAIGSGPLAVTERSNSSFSLLLERVAHRWGPASTAPSAAGAPASPLHHGVEPTAGSFSLCGLCSRENSRASLPRLHLASDANDDMVVEASGASLTAMLSAMVPCLPGRRSGVAVLEDQPHPSGSAVMADHSLDGVIMAAVEEDEVQQEGVADCLPPGGAVGAALLLQ